MKKIIFILLIALGSINSTKAFMAGDDGEYALSQISYERQSTLRDLETRKAEIIAERASRNEMVRSQMTQPPVNFDHYTQSPLLLSVQARQALQARALYSNSRLFWLLVKTALGGCFFGVLLIIGTRLQPKRQPIMILQSPFTIQLSPENRSRKLRGVVMGVQ